MTIENHDPGLLQEFEASFEAIEKALGTAAEERSFGPAATTAELLGLKEKEDQRHERFSGTHVWERRNGDLCLLLRTRWYDQSHPFSIQPDMNVMSLELRRGSMVLRFAESRYED
jgi:hypothetical protein